MGDLNTNRLPINDIQITDENILAEYNNKMNNSNYSSAVAKLNEKHFENGGIRASIFNVLKKSIIDLEIFILNLTADQDTLYSLNEPTNQQMGDRIFWIQPIVNDGGNKIR